MINSNQITESVFDELVKCIAKKGSIVSNRHYTPNGLYAIELNNKPINYINIFEAFNNLYIMFNCKRNLFHIINSFPLNKEIHILSDTDVIVNNFSIEEKRLALDLELCILKNEKLIKLTEDEKHYIESLISYSRVNKESKKLILNKFKEKLKEIQESEALKPLDRIKFKKNLEEIKNFFRNLEYKI
jgi:hypothetical protein